MNKVLLLLGFLALTLTLPASAKYPEFVELVEKTSPAVVNIRATRSATPNRFDGPDEQQVPEIFRRFFRDMPDQRVPRPSAGSGF